MDVTEINLFTISSFVLFIYWCDRVTALLLSYHSTALGSSASDISFFFFISYGWIVGGMIALYYTRSKKRQKGKHRHNRTSFIVIILMYNML